MKNINFVSYFKKANIISIILFTMSILLVFFKGLNYGIDFKGGTLIELRTEKSIKASSIRDTLSSMNLGDVNVKKFGKDGDYLIKVEQKESNNNELIPEIKKKLTDNLNAEIDFRRVENVGPKVSAELLESSIIALFHDVVITLGIFSLLSLEINLSIIAAVLTIVGYSMNDTVVIYDRIRENLFKYTKISISDIANLSINETLARTIITSVTTLLALVSIYTLGGEILRGFSFAMILGVIIGTYSSIFVASPILKFFKVSYKTLEKEEEKIVP